MSEARALFDRLVTVHRPDCAVLAAPAGFSAEPVIGQGELGQMFGSDAAAAYAVEARVIFEDLRRIIGQLAGFLILARLTRRRELLDLSELQAASKRWANSVAALASLKVPSPLAGHRKLLETAIGLCGEVLRQIEDLAKPDRTEDALDTASDRIKDAYAALERTASHKAGLVMVDFSNACCNCGR